MQNQLHNLPVKVNLSWLADLDAYVSSHPGDDCHDRPGLVAAVKACPQSAEAWRALLAYEEGHSGNLTQQQGATSDPSRVSLYHLYYYATQLVPRNKNQLKEAYLQLWLGLARQQWARSQDDARDTFKTLKNQHIGDSSAHLYYEWAVLEHSAGNVSKALGIIARGMRADAQPASLLQQLQGELQSGTFDLKAAGAVTETLTLEAGALAAQHVDGTPAPNTNHGQRPGVPYSSSSVSRATALTAVTHMGRGSSMASCLKASAAATAAGGMAAPHEHHAARAVTFAADVHDAADELAGVPSHAHRAGNVMASSQRSAGQDGHSGCLSNMSSTPSRSVASVHDGTMPFSSGAVSYKSSTTESSTMDGLEEATISCGVAAAGPAGSKGSAKPSTAPLVGATSTTPAGGASANTATLGLKRFGFKSRALRVGGASETAAAAGPLAGEVAADAPASSSAAGSSVVPAVEDSSDAAAGRKRRAAAGSTPSPSVSPKLAAAVRHGLQCRVQPGEQLGDEGAAAGDDRVQGSGSQPEGGAPSRHTGDAAASTDDDSVPLVGSKLAARVSQERGTPLPAGRGRDAVAHGMGLWSSPVEGQLPSSLETTPSDVLPALPAPAGSSRGPRSDEQAAEQDRAQLNGSGRQQSKRPAASSRQPLAAVPAYSAAPQEAADEDAGPPPTVVLPDVAAVACTAGGTSRASAMPQDCTPRGTQSSSNGARQQQQQQQQPAAPREPLRPLQAPQQAPTGSATTKAQLAGVVQKPAAGDAQVPAAGVALQAQQAQPEQQRRHRPQEVAPVQQQQQQPGSQQQVQQQQQHCQQPGQQPQQQQKVVRQARPKEDPQTVLVQGVRYHKLECVGRGGSSKVFKVMGPGCKIFALKRIKLAGRDEEAASGFIDEINLLKCLRNKPNIIQLVDSQVFTEEGLIYMVQEYGEIDLARLLAKHDAARREAGNLRDNIDENFIRLYWQQMLQAVAGVHEQRIVHSDLKPANFLLVEGQLKLIDFGIAKAISGDTTSIARESQVGTLNYMSPEAILGGSNNILGGPAMKVGRPSDIWSLGCILYQMVFGRTPFADLPFMPKMHAICNPQHCITYPELANRDLLDVMKRCLDRDPKARITLQELLDHPFLHPNRLSAAAPAAVPVLSEEQMKLLVAQVQAAGAAGLTDLDKLTRELMQRLGATTLSSSSTSTTGSASGSSTPEGTAGLEQCSNAAAPDGRPRQRPASGQQRAQGAGVSGSRSSSRPQIPTAAPPQPGWR